MRPSSALIRTLLLLLFCSSTFSQTEQQRPRPTGWLLEVRFLKSVPPAYQSVRWRDSKTPGNWFGRFGREPGWQLPAGDPPIRAVRIAPHLDGEIVKVTVSVMRGEQFMDKEEEVAVYGLTENEKVTVEPLKNFGVEPFELRAFRVSPVLGNLPTTINKTTAVALVGIEPINSDLPELKLSLQNLSSKTIDAVRLEFLEGQRSVGSAMPHGRDGKPLMLGGEIVQVTMPLGVRAAGTEGVYYPASIPHEQIVIKTVIFSDGTTEGIIDRDMESGPAFESVKIGRRIILRRALPLMAVAYDSKEGSAQGGAASLRSQLETLSVKIDSADLDALQRRFPGRDASLLASPVHLGIHIMRKAMLDDLARFEAGKEGTDFKAWLLKARHRYTEWLARLEITDPS